ncbi:MAG: hypothetical protein V1734_05610 [Nanoarchaeota archaeon]
MEKTYMRDWKRAEDDIEEIKKKLKSYKAEDIEFNEPHFTQQLILREGSRKEVIKHLLNPESLAYSYPEKGKYGDIKHCLLFKISNSRTMKIPVLFDRNSKKGLYIITYIMTYRHWKKVAWRN